MDKQLDEALSRDVATQVSSKAKAPFDNAYKAALAIEGAIYVQGFLVNKSRRPVEHGWIEVGDRIVDPTFPFWKATAASLFYFAAQRLTVKQLKVMIEEAQEDYPEDNPLPIYGSTPYEYYGDVMLGGMEYVEAFQAAEAKSQQRSS